VNRCLNYLGLLKEKDDLESDSLESLKLFYFLNVVEKNRNLNETFSIFLRKGRVNENTQIMQIKHKFPWKAIRELLVNRKS
jgi:hypothetical protein